MQLMPYIEPCCLEKQMDEWMERCEGIDNGYSSCAHLFSNSDWSVGRLIAYLTRRTPGCELTVCTFGVGQELYDTLARLMNESYVVDASKGSTRPLVSKLNLLCRKSREGMLHASDLSHGVMRGDFRTGRAAYAEDNIGFRCIAVANEHRCVVVQGSLNQETGGGVQMLTVNTERQVYNECMTVLHAKMRARTQKL